MHIAGAPFSILWFGQRWSKYQRRDRQIVSRLARYPDVEHIMLVEPPLPLTSLAAWWSGRDEDAIETWRRVGRHGLAWRPQPGVTVSPAVVPLAGYGGIRARWLHVARCRQARKLLRQHRPSRLVLWLGGPYRTSGLVGQFGEDAVCYSLCEDFREKDPRHRAMIESEDAVLRDRANLVVVVREALAAQSAAARHKTVVIPNGVDVDALQRGRSKLVDSRLYANRRQPVLGFVGGIHEGIDVELVHQVARLRKDWNIVMIGPISSGARTLTDRLELPNLHFTGSCPFDDVPSHVSRFDVALLPYKRSPRNECCSSMKMYVYLGLGKPIVGTPVADAEQFPDSVTPASTPEQFVAAIESELKHDSETRRRARVQTARRESWDGRVQAIHESIRGLLS